MSLHSKVGFTEEGHVSGHTGTCNLNSKIGTLRRDENQRSQRKTLD
jgi:hypothetical protein